MVKEYEVTKLINFAHIKYRIGNIIPITNNTTPFSLIVEEILSS